MEAAVQCLYTIYVVSSFTGHILYRAQHLSFHGDYFFGGVDGIAVIIFTDCDHLFSALRLVKDFLDIFGVKRAKVGGGDIPDNVFFPEDGVSAHNFLLEIIGYGFGIDL